MSTGGEARGRFARLLWPERDSDALLYIACALLAAVSVAWLASLFN